MSELGLGTAGRSNMREAAPDLLDPERIPADDRLQEIASLLARGFVRYWRREAVDGGEKDLAILRTSSEVCDEPQSEGESL